MTLQIDGLHKAFGPVVALDGLTFDVPAGQIFGFLGANGAGKTTTMRIALGVLAANRGEIRWHGVDSRSLPRATWPVILPAILSHVASHRRGRQFAELDH